MSLVVGLPNNSYQPVTNSDKVYQLLAHGRWFSPGTPASSTTKTGSQDIAEILLKVAINTQKSINQSRLVKQVVITRGPPEPASLISSFTNFMFNQV